MLNRNDFGASRALGLLGLLIGAALAGCGEDHPVESTNRPPAITTPATEQVSEGELLQITPQVSDPDDDVLRLSAAPMPASNATFDPQSGVFNWTPEYDSARADPYVVTFTADDGRQSIQATTAITVVDVNRPPVLHLPPAKSVVVGDQLSFNVTATDPDTEDTVTVIVLDPPDGASFDGLAFTWSPVARQHGVHLVSFLANDNHALSPAQTASDGMLILVSEGCVYNGQCQESQVCVAGACGSCTATSQCNPGRVCVAGACGPCADDDQCTGDQVCVDGVCGGCSDNSDCDQDQACVLGVCGPCAGAGQCDPGEGCRAGVCGGCTDNNDCIPGQVCPFGICGACESASECAAGQGCVSGLCGGCTSGSQCRAGQGCVSGVCGPCTDRSQCAPGQACDTNVCGRCDSSTECGGQGCVDGVCAPCSDNTDCAVGQACLSGACGACSDNTDCAPGQACVAGVCGPCTGAAVCGPGQGCVGGTCGPCSDNSHCNSDDVCSVGVCRECASNLDCAAGKVCLAGLCNPCTASGQCSAGQACIAGSCGPCTTSGQCPGGQSCYGGACRAAAPSCRAVHDADTSLPDGPYLIAEDGQTITEYCDMTRDGGGWTRCLSWIGIKTGKTGNSGSGDYAAELLDYNNPRGGEITLPDLRENCNRDGATVQYRATAYNIGLVASTRFQAGPNVFSGTGQYTFPALSNSGALTLSAWYYNGTDMAWNTPSGVISPKAFASASKVIFAGSAATGGPYNYIVVQSCGLSGFTWTSDLCSSVKISLWFRDKCVSPPCTCQLNVDCPAGQACYGGTCG